jgi:competence protein ComEC
MTSSRILFLLCLSLIAGIFLESIIKIPQIFLWAFLFAGVLIIIIFLFLKKDVFVVVGFCLLFLALGVIRMQVSEFNILNDELSKLNDTEKISLTGVVIDEPNVKDSSQKIKVKIDDSMVLVTTSRYPEYQYLDKLNLNGKLETPMETEDFSYKNYLLKDHIYSVMYFPKIEITGKASGDLVSAVYSKILWLKGKLRTSIQNNFLPPQSSVLQGIILGDNNSIPQDIKNKFKITGVSHIIAVSGTHVVILSSILMSFLLFLGLWRKQAFCVAVIFICVYVVLVGLPSSGIRAGIMGIIYLSGQALGRQSTSSRVIVLAACMMLLFNPLFLFYDIGFQLSFMAVLGLIYFEPLIRGFIKFLASKFFRIRIKEKYESAIMMLSATIAAQIFTLPIIVYNFGNISFVSPLTNLLILPTVYYLMLFGFLSSLAGLIWSSLGWLLSVPCYFLMAYFLWIVDVFSKPWAYKIISNVSWVWLVVSYILIGFVTRYFNKNQKIKFLGY